MITNYDDDLNMRNHSLYIYLRLFHMFLSLSLSRYKCFISIRRFNLTITFNDGPYAGGSKVEINKSSKTKQMDHEIRVFLSDLHHILHVRSCNHFRWFQHTPEPPRPLNRPKHFNFLFIIFQLSLFGFIF